MSKWECAHPGCHISAVGVGGAHGLRFIGWFVQLRYSAYPLILCPAHRPDPVPRRRDDCADPLCSLCRAEQDARMLQSTLDPDAAFIPVLRAGDRIL